MIGEPVKYQGAPSMAYKVGPYIIDREGNLTGEDFGPIHSYLVENGYIQEPEIPEVEEFVVTDTRGSSSGGDGGAS